jgi:hypothetical protein
MHRATGARWRRLRAGRPGRGRLIKKNPKTSFGGVDLAVGQRQDMLLRGGATEGGPPSTVETRRPRFATASSHLAVGQRQDMPSRRLALPGRGAAGRTEPAGASSQAAAPDTWRPAAGRARHQLAARTQVPILRFAAEARGGLAGARDHPCPKPSHCPRGSHRPRITTGGRLLPVGPRQHVAGTWPGGGIGQARGIDCQAGGRRQLRAGARQLVAGARQQLPGGARRLAVPLPPLIGGLQG